MDETDHALQNTEPPSLKSILEVGGHASSNVQLGQVSYRPAFASSIFDRIRISNLSGPETGCVGSSSGTGIGVNECD